MALLWSAFPTPAFMLIVQVALFWGGLWLLATALKRNVILIVGLSPMALYYNGTLLKDSLLCSTLVFAAGLLANGWRWPAGGTAVAAAFLRVNAGFALAPFIVRRHRLAWTIVIAVVSGFAVQGVSQSFAQRTHVERSLPLYDLAGIDHFSGRHRFPEGCYTRLFWDTLLTGRCGYAFQRSSGSIMQQWLSAIATHPVAYAKHRLLQFNSATFFIVPPAQQCVEAPLMHDCPVPLWNDALSKNVLVWPCVWLAVGLALLFLPNLGPTASGIALSGVTYGFAYAVVGVASEFRYFYWTEIAVQLALVIAWTRSVNLRFPVAVGAVTMLIGLAARYL